MSNIIAKIVTSFPIDQAAARVTASGSWFVPEKIIQTNDSEFPILTRKPNKQELGQQCFTDLAGSKFGRFTVIGIAKDFPGQWVVRCTCGTYTTRKAKAIKNPNNSRDCCEHCRYLAYLKNSVSKRISGQDLSCRGYA